MHFYIFAAKIELEGNTCHLATSIARPPYPMGCTGNAVYVTTLPITLPELSKESAGSTSVTSDLFIRNGAEFSGHTILTVALIVVLSLGVSKILNTKLHHITIFNCLYFSLLLILCNGKSLCEFVHISGVGLYSAYTYLVPISWHYLMNHRNEACEVLYWKCVINAPKKYV